MKPVLLDIMCEGRFLCQLHYNKRGFAQMIDGEFVEVHDKKDIEDFIYSQRPSLKGKNIRIEFSNQSV